MTASVADGRVLVSEARMRVLTDVSLLARYDDIVDYFLPCTFVAAIHTCFVDEAPSGWVLKSSCLLFSLLQVSARPFRPPM